jgi:hypothetical protein
MMLAIKFGENRTNRSEVIQIFVNSKMADGGHLEFSTLRMFQWNCLLWVEHRMLHAKFGANRTNRLEVIQIFVFSRWRWVAILDFQKYDF